MNLSQLQLKSHSSLWSRTQILPPQAPVFHLVIVSGSLLLNPPLWISFSRRSRDQPYPNLTWALVVRALLKTEVWGCELRQPPLPGECWQWSTYNRRKTAPLHFWMLSMVLRAVLPVGSYREWGEGWVDWPFFQIWLKKFRLKVFLIVLLKNGHSKKVFFTIFIV